jgi:cytochrome oxidase Cu insertion factor (SCO1/SenC/PrrC family)
LNRLCVLALAAAGLVACVPASIDASFEEDGFAGYEGEGGEDQVTSEFYEGGGWKKDTECRDTIEATGNAVGDITEDITLTDQFGEDVRLYDFCGRAVLLVSGAFW